MKFLKHICIFCLGISQTYASIDPVEIPTDTIELEAIEITANRLVNFTSGAKVVNIVPQIKTEYNSSNLSEVLAQLTSVSVKSYGLAGQSSISLRGLHSKHTAVLWNGINVQNTMNGGFDMNSFPAFFIDAIDIQHGGSGALYGSGAVSGIIHLNNEMKFDSTFRVEFQQGISSFNNYFDGAKVKYSNNRLTNSTGVFYKYGKNDFEYINTQQFGDPKVKQENAASEQYGLLQSNSLKINNYQKITSNILAQKHYLEIPTRTTGSNSRQNQNTETLKIALVWNRNGDYSSWYSRLFYNYESLIYRDPAISLISEMGNYSAVAELENKVSIKDNFLLNTGLNHTFEKVTTENYGTDRQRNRTSLFSSLKFFTRNELISTTISLREELVDNELLPLTYSLSTCSYPLDFLKIFANISKIYNNPSFNDLYWVPGGDSTLSPENGWSWDAGTSLNLKSQSNNYKFDFSYFNTKLNDHIIWLPDELGVWTAMNVEELWSRGIESSFSHSFNRKNLGLQTSINYTYTKSTYGNSPESNTESSGNQLIYIPVHKASGTFSASYKKYYLRFYLNHVSKRYTSKNNSTYIDPYLLLDFTVGSNFNFKTSGINLNFKIHNILNTEYEVMAYYPMPLRYYSLNITYKFNKPIKK